MRYSKAKELGHVSELHLGDAQIEDLAFQLLTIYYADRPIKKLLGKYDFPGISARFDDIKQEKITNLLVQIATLHRIRHWRQTDNGKFRVHNHDVGILFVEGQDEELPLYMIEACNKIIHAERIIFDARKVRGAHFHYLEDWITIQGTKGKGKWEAVLAITYFCEQALYGLDWIDVPF